MTHKTRAASLDDAIVPTVEIELGRPRRLRLDFNALVRIEEATGFNLLADSEWFTRLTAKHLRGIVWACLERDGGPESTLDEVGAMLGLGSLGKIMEAFGELWRLSMPNAEAAPIGDAGEKAEPPFAGQPSGSTSGP